MDKFKCPNCGSQNIEVIDEYEVRIIVQGYHEYDCHEFAVKCCDCKRRFVEFDEDVPDGAMIEDICE